LVLSGTAGTGKTFVALYLALESMLEKGTPYDKVIIVRSVVPTRDVGYFTRIMEENKKCLKHHTKQLVQNYLEIVDVHFIIK